MRKTFLILSISFGVMIGLGCATFYYAKGYSYMLDDPSVCTNCHVMNDEYSSWIKSSHHSVAGCNDCHTPRSTAGKWTTKAVNGWNHGYAFTSGNFQSPIRINERNIQIAEENCRYCHNIFISNLTFHETDDSKIRCTSCHSNTGHLK